MKILAVDTSAVVASCAISEDDKLLGVYTVNNRLTHSQMIMPMIDRLLSDTECNIDDIDLFAASIGPGSYTGLRIGAATVKGLAAARNKNAIGIGTLDALAFNVQHSEHIVVPIMDARKNRVFTASYIWEDGEMRMLSEPEVMMIDKCIEDCGNFLDTVFVGDGAYAYRDLIKEKLGEHAYFAASSNMLQNAASVCALAYMKRNEAAPGRFLVPRYIGKKQGDK